jgi:hypothetical protein
MSHGRLGPSGQPVQVRGMIIDWAEMMRMALRLRGATPEQAILLVEGIKRLAEPAAFAAWERKIPPEVLFAMARELTGPRGAEAAAEILQSFLDQMTRRLRITDQELVEALRKLQSN